MPFCRVCRSSDLSCVLDLGMQPWGNHFLHKDEIGREPFYPLRVLFCHACSLAQLDYTVKKEIMFSDHTYLSGMTSSLDSHFQTVAQEVHARFCKPNATVLDIGSNDGTQLVHYKKLGYHVLGIESSKRIAEIANTRGIPTMHAFFNLQCIDNLSMQFDVINASGVFFHLEELHEATEAVCKLLKDEGVFVIQFLYMKKIQENCAFDQIYHEHLLYYTLQSLKALFSLHGLVLFDAYLSEIHGGSIVGFVSHPEKYPCTQRLHKLEQEEEISGCNRYEAYETFAQTVEQVKKRNLYDLEKRKSQNKRIFGLGAPVKGNTLLNYFKIGPTILDYLVEINPLRANLFSPGQHIPIKLENEIHNPPDVYYVLAWNFRDEILKRNQNLIDRGVEFYFPITFK